MLEPGKAKGNHEGDKEIFICVLCRLSKVLCFKIQHVPISLVVRSLNSPVSKPLWDPNHFVEEVSPHWSELRFLLTVPLLTAHLLTALSPFHLVPISSNALPLKNYIYLLFHREAFMTCTCRGQRTACGISSLSAACGSYLGPNSGPQTWDLWASILAWASHWVFLLIFCEKFN